MKILYHHRIASKDGQYVHVQELTNAMLEHGHQLTFVAPGFTKASGFGDEGGIATKLKAMLPQWIYELLELGYSGLVAIKLTKAILKDRPDFIYERYNLYQPAGVIVSMIFRLPILMEINAPLVDERRKYDGLALPRFAKMIEGFTWKYSGAALPVTKVLGDIVANRGTSQKNIHVIHNGINLNIYNQLEVPKALGKEQRLVIGFVGFIHPWHRMDLAIDALAECSNNCVELVCVGEGDIRPELEAQAQARGVSDRVTFTGLKDRDQVFDYVAKFDIAVQPAVTPYASPLKLFEYLAAGCLIIAPDSENILEIVNDHNALLYRSGDTADFKDKLLYAVEHIHELDKLRINARKLILEKRFFWQANAERVVKIAQDLIGH
ncbi:glycosyltransferase [bacterium]|nr:glycosyltransferase [bacterium]